MKILSVPILLASSFVFAQENSNKDTVRVLDALTVESSPLRNQDNGCHSGLECSLR